MHPPGIGACTDPAIAGPAVRSLGRLGGLRAAPSRGGARADPPGQWLRRLPRRSTRARGHLAPQALERVELAHLGHEDVDDDVEVVHQHPLRLRQRPRRGAGGSPCSSLQPSVDRVVDRLDLAVGAARADHEVVGVVDDAAQVELDDVDAPSCPPRRRRSAPRAGSGVTGRAPPVRCRPPTASGTRKSIRAPVAHAPAQRRRGDVQPRHVDVADALRLPPGRRAGRGPPRGGPPRAPPPPSDASPRIASGSCQVGSDQAMSPPTMKVSSSPGRLAWISRSVSTVYDGPARSTSIALTVEPVVVAADRAGGTSRGGGAAPGSSSICLCGGTPGRHEQHAVEPELRSAPRSRRRGARGAAG